MVLTRNEIRKLILREMKSLLEVDESISSESEFLGRELDYFLMSASDPLKRSVKSVEIDTDRGEIVVHLYPGKARPATDRQIACSLKNKINDLDLQGNWVLNPCTYDDESDEDYIMIVGL